MTSPSSAVLFDVDGTLVDSNYQHVVAWQRAFHDIGEAVQARRIHECIGMGGTLLVQELLGDPSDEDMDEAKRLHSLYFGEYSESLQVVPGARDLVRAVHDRGLRVVLASSAGSDEFEVLRSILDVDEHIHASTSSADVEQEKPDPSLVEAALKKAGVPAGRAVMVGDGVWDAIAAKRAGVPTIGMLSGGIGSNRLIEAGAVAVYADAIELRDHIESSPIGALGKQDRRPGSKD
ncbi:HAD family hydrolase [Rhodococcus sp. NPDC058521]|uniref:HAD family hydrolase n=1 Tax=Rhodococcus sp. NPDC058521 TaxID=3346536 RepID=UPI003655E633